jgi:alpha-amylase/alpha-mannosidase (GH57 family)
MSPLNQSQKILSQPLSQALSERKPQPDLERIETPLSDLDQADLGGIPASRGAVMGPAVSPSAAPAMAQDPVPGSFQGRSAQIPLGTNVKRFVTLHGHFYQPPREHPYLNVIERQPGASPFHDWNERILAECYRPNAFARILDDQGQVLQIVNNYEYLSFNFGPTLLTWLERHDLEVYRRILEADKTSAARLEGHGNAIAQVYNHVILPLANDRDKRTQIRWGIADFRHRFGRDPLGMWLAEAAIDQATLKVLVEEGIRFIILAPTQAEACRPLGSDGKPAGSWQDVSSAQIDPRRPYRCFTADGKGYLDIFFYDGPISGDMGFSDLVYSSARMADRLAGAMDPNVDRIQLVSCATDGETFGHHKRGVERTIAYGFVQEFPQRGWGVTNYSHFLSLHPPQWEVKLKPVTAWSCSHGVGRWTRDCGCGGGGTWHQRWRQPLRHALNWLRDQLDRIYSAQAHPYLKDPWRARDAYIEVILDREKLSGFWLAQQRRPLSAPEQTEVLRLLEMQRFGQLMFTSCGWFFEELSRPEGVQILRYAARAIELAGEISNLSLEPEFISRLAAAPSNVAQFRDGAELYRQMVRPVLIGMSQIAAQFAMTSTVVQSHRHGSLHGYELEHLDRDRRAVGGGSLVVGRLLLNAPRTQELRDLIYAVLHLGGWDFHCGVLAFPGQRHYEDLKHELLDGSRRLSRPALVMLIGKYFGSQTFDLGDLFGDDRQRLMQLLTQDTLDRLGENYRQIYLDNYSIVLGLRLDHLPVPEELQAAAQIALNQRLRACLKGLAIEEDLAVMEDLTGELRAVIEEADQLGCILRRGEAAATLNDLIHRHLWQIAHDFDPERFAHHLQLATFWLQLAQELRLELPLDRLQEFYLACLEQHLSPRCATWPQQDCEDIPTPQLLQVLRLGPLLEVNVQSWWDRLQDRS